MQFKSRYPWVAVVVIVGVIFSTAALAQVKTDRLAEGLRLKKTILENHFRAVVADDIFSQAVFANMLVQLDPEKIYFIASDIQEIEPFRSSIDDNWNAGTLEYLDKVTSVFKLALQRARLIEAQSLQQNIDWKTSGKWQPGNAVTFCKNELELINRWNTWIKYNVLMQMDALHQRDSTHKKIDLNFVLSHETEEKKRARNHAEKAIKQMLDFSGGFENKMASIYFKSIAARFDPHTVYISPYEIEGFMGALSSQELSFGLGLRENERGDVFIEHLVPGGPAWKSGKLHQKDFLLRIKTPDGPVELSGIGLEGLSEILGDDFHASIELTVQKPDGELQIVPLKKEQIDDDSNIVKGFVLNGSSKVGYISLPGFYSDWGSNEGSSCADDMAKEILKLKKENIQGLILDIRANGGGSVPEAIELSGIFIDEGPLAVFKDKTGKVTTLKDVNRGTIYDGPLVLLIDGRSASAAEMLAGVLQDYHRAVIAGSPSFGKATSQRIFPLDPADRANKKNPPMAGFATITVDKIYRVTGKSIQGSGVVPDIRLPDIYDHIIPHESALPGALAKDSVTVRLPYHPLSPLPIGLLQQKSEARVNSNAQFIFIKESNKKFIKKIAESDQFVILDWDKFLNDDSPGDLSMKAAHPKIISISPPDFDKAQADRIPYATEYNAMWIQNLSTDEYVYEAYQVICNYLEIKK